jgi:hypothetical protein
VVCTDEARLAELPVLLKQLAEGDSSARTKIEAIFSPGPRMPLGHAAGKGRNFPP